FLRDLATRAGLGSYYAHVSSVDEVRTALGDEIAQLRSVQETDLEIALRPGAGVSIVEVFRLLPQQLGIPIGANGAHDALAALDRAATAGPDGSAWRALRTIVAQQAHLPTLGSAPAPGAKS